MKALRRLLPREGRERYVAVDRVAAETGGDVVLDCTGLEFVGVGGLRGMVSAANVLSQQGHRLRVRGLSPYYARILPLAGWDNSPGLVLERPERL